MTFDKMSVGRSTAIHLALDTTHDNTAHKIALGQEKEQDDGRGHHDTRRHQQIFPMFHRVNIARYFLEVLDANRQSVFVLVVQEDKGL